MPELVVVAVECLAWRLYSGLVELLELGKFLTRELDAVFLCWLVVGFIFWESYPYAIELFLIGLRLV